jgi:hypothetical protein
MRKLILGAGAALALVSSEVSAQTQTPAPVVALGEETLNGSKVDQTVFRRKAAAEATAPVVAIDSGAPISSVGGDVLSASAAGGSGARAYAEASYLLMFIKDHGVATPLLTGGPSNGVIGRPGTTVLAGSTNIDYGNAGGVRAALGTFLGDSRFGFEVSSLYLGRVSETQTLAPSSAQTWARPFFDTNSRLENAKVIASPGAYQGSLTVDSALQIWGFEANPFLRVVQGDYVTFDLITGFRYFQATETLSIYDSVNLLPGGVYAWNGVGLANPGSVVVHDHIGARNQFYGGQIGGKLSFGNGGLFLDLTGKVAIGGVRQVVTVDGSTTLNRGTVVAPASTKGGFLASGTYLGERSENRFAVLPEGNVQLGYQLTSWANVFAGYSFLYLSSAARPGDQLNRNLALNLIPTSPNYNNRIPAQNRGLTVVDNELWVHGFNFGMTFSY